MPLSNLPGPSSGYLLDVNVLVALLDEDHVHHPLITGWFRGSDPLHWAVCPFTEAGFLRYATAPRLGQVSMGEATQILADIARHPGYSWLAIASSWAVLSSPFSKRLYGTKQVTDAYLLGLAVQQRLRLVTLDRGILHLAGEYRDYVHLLTEQVTPRQA